jgi:exodeoxyribonuclease VII small subunit
MSTNGSSSKSAHGSNGESFEESFRQLQEVVRRLSEGSLTLQESLASFEEGMRLAERCSTMLDEAELRVRQVSERAMQEGAASLTALEPSAAAQPLGDIALVEVEVDRYEAVVLDTADQDGATKRTPRPVEKSSLSHPTFADELDPLFDEED